MTERSREVVDAELRLLAAVRATCRDEGGPAPDVAVVDELLDERGADSGGPVENPAPGR